MVFSMSCGEREAAMGSLRITGAPSWLLSSSWEDRLEASNTRKGQNPVGRDGTSLSASWGASD